ncbi:hypothetical protein Bca101_043112 [Brassica carinata]
MNWLSLERELLPLKRTWAIYSFGLYLYSVVLKEKGNESLAPASLVESVNSYTWNWNAWSELQSLFTYQELKMHTESLPKYEYRQDLSLAASLAITTVTA